MYKSLNSIFFSSLVAAGLLISSTPAQAQRFPFVHGKTNASAVSGIANSQAKVNALVSRPGISQDFIATGQGTWQLDAISTYTYDSQGRLTLRVYTDATTNQQMAKESTTYDAHGNESLYKIEQWNGASWDVVNAYKIITTYNSQGLKTEEIFQDWDSFTNSWENEARTITTYDASNRALEITNSEWDNNAWVLVDRMVLSHVNGTATSALVQEHNGAAWEDILQVQNLTWHVLYEIPSAYTLAYNDNGTWVNAEKYNAVYDPNGGHIGIYQEWDATSNLWANASRETETYDNNRNFTGWKDELFDPATNGWINQGEEKEILTYSGIDITERVFQDSWNQTQTLQDQRKEVYSNFQTFNVAGVKPALPELAASVYPNPTSASLTISFPENKGAFTATLTDITGKMWLTQQFKSTNAATLNIEALPKGIYLLQLQTEAGSTVKRIVKQ